MATVEPTPVPAGRAGEFWLLVLGLLIGISAYALVGLTMNDTLPVTFYRDAALLALFAFGLHFVVRWRAPYADPILIPVAVALNGIGLATIFQINQATNPDNTLASRQMMWTLLSMVAAGAVLFVLRDHRTLRRYTYLSLLIGAGLLIMPLIPGIGVEINGARIWVRLGPASFQPAELAKIAFAIFCAGYLVTNRDTLAIAGRKVLGLQLPRLRDFGPLLLALSVSVAVLVLQRDLGTSLLFFGMFLGMLYIATERISWIIIGLGLFGAAALVAVKTFGHVAARFNGWINAMDNSVYEAVGGSAQLVGGLFGLANGGLFGTGWGRGYPQLVPFSYSDFIVTSVGEILGLTGIFAILTLYLIMIQRGFRIAVGTRDGFGKLLAGGIAFAFAWQCFVVIGGVTRVIPITGLTTPFLAYGGSSLLANWVIIAVLLRISDNARRPHPLPLRRDAAPTEIGRPLQEVA